MQADRRDRPTARDRPPPLPARVRCPPLLAVVVLMFSLEGAPGRARAGGAAGDVRRRPGRRRVARQIAAAAPERSPGSDGDAAVADLVAERFEEIQAGAVSRAGVRRRVRRRATSSLRNVILTLPGRRRDATSRASPPATRPTGPGAASSAAATGVLLELADALGGTSHEKTCLRLDRRPARRRRRGARAARGPARARADRGRGRHLPARRRRAARRPTCSRARPATQRLGAARAHRRARGRRPRPAADRPEPSAFTQLARLALPSGLGEQAPLIADGHRRGRDLAPPASDRSPPPRTSPRTSRRDARRVRARGPVDGPRPRPSRRRLDARARDLPRARRQPDPRLDAGAARAGADAARGGRRRRRRARGRCARGSALGAGLAWAAARALPFLGALLALYPLGARRASSRDPRSRSTPACYELGVRAAIALVADRARRARRSASLLRLAGSPARGRGAPAAALGARRRRGRRCSALARQPLPGAAAGAGRSRLAAGRAGPGAPRRGGRRARGAGRLRPGVAALAAVAPRSTSAPRRPGPSC